MQVKLGLCHLSLERLVLVLGVQLVKVVPDNVFWMVLIALQEVLIICLVQTLSKSKLPLILIQFLLFFILFFLFVFHCLFLILVRLCLQLGSILVLLGNRLILVIYLLSVVLGDLFGLLGLLQQLILDLIVLKLLNHLLTCFNVGEVLGFSEIILLLSSLRVGFLDKLINLCWSQRLLDRGFSFVSIGIFSIRLTIFACP